MCKRCEGEILVVNVYSSDEVLREMSNRLLILTRINHLLLNYCLIIFLSKFIHILVVGEVITRLHYFG